MNQELHSPAGLPAYTIREAADLLGVKPWPVHVAIARGELAARRVPGAELVLIPQAALAAYIDSLPVAELGVQA